MDRFQFVYNRELCRNLPLGTTTDTVDGEVMRLADPFRFVGTPRKYGRLIMVSLPTAIANIFRDSDLDCASAKVTVTAGVNSATFIIRLPNGNYTASAVMAALNSALYNPAYALFPDGSAPLTFGFTATTGYTFLSIDVTKTNDPAIDSVRIDFSNAGTSYLHYVLGFNPGNITFTRAATTTVESPNQANLNLYGDSVLLQLSGLGALSNYNGSVGQVLATIPLIPSVNSNTIVYPWGFTLPILTLATCGSMIDQLRFSIIGTKSDPRAIGRPLPVRWVDGNFSVCIEVAYGNGVY